MDIKAQSGINGPRMAAATLVTSVVLTSTALFSGAAAQESEPALAAGLPQGISVTLLGDQVLDGSSGPTATIRFDRISIAPDASTETLTTVGPTIVIAESGNALLRDAALGLEGSLDEGESRPLPADVGFALRNDGTEPVSLLLLELVPPGGAPSAPTGSGTESTVLVAAADTELPATPSHLFALAVSLEPGASLGETRFEGPLGIAVTGGELAVTGPTGMTGTLPNGAGLLLPSGTPNVIANEGTATATILAFGVLPEISLVPSPIGVVDPGSSPEATAVAGVLFKATANENEFEDWALSNGWKVVQHGLLNDGSSGRDDWDYLVAPFEPGAQGFDDYAVEASVDWLRDGRGYGLFARSEGDSEYVAGIVTQPGDCADYYPQIAFVARDTSFSTPNGCATISDILASADRSWDKKWHTLRMEVDGTEIRLSVDGKNLVRTDDARLSTGGAAGLWSWGNQIRVRCFAVMTVETHDAC